MGDIPGRKGALPHQSLSQIPAKDRALVLLALGALYLFWGSTYLGIRIAIEGIPPLLMAGTRHFIAGALLYLVLRFRGTPAPGLREWGGAALIGTFLLLGGNGGVCLAEQWVATGLSSLVVATVPLWMLLFARLFGHPVRGREWAGLALGLAGVALLNLEGDFRANPQGLAFLLLAAVSWAFGSVWGARLPQPPGLMGASAQMLGGGTALLAAGLLAGERATGLPPVRPLLALLYLVVFGSLVGFSAYLFLLSRVRPALASSYAYVNPMIAVVLGMLVLGEHLSWTGAAAMLVIVSGVAMTLID